MKIELTVRGEKREFPFCSRRAAARYVRRFGGRISYLVLLTSQGLFDKLYASDGTLRAIVGEIDEMTEASDD